MTRTLLLAWLATASATLGLIQSEAASAQDAGDFFATANEAFQAGDYGTALSLYEQARDSGSPGPAVHYNIGVSQYRLGRYAGAEATFRMLGMQFPAMRALAEYNIGLTLLRQNREDEAIGHFEFARSNSDDRSIVALAETALRRINPDPVPSAASASQWTALLDFALGYDDNVALIDESTIPTGQTADSGFAELVGVFSGPIGSGSGLRFDGSLYAVNYMDAGEFDQTALRIGGFYHWRRSDWRFDIGPYLNRSTLAGDGFEQRLGLSMTARKQLGVSSLIRLRLTHATVDEIDSRYAFIAGSRNQLTLGWDKYGANGRLSLEYQLEDNDRADPGVSPSRNQVRLRYRYAINPKLRFDTSISLRDSAYDDLAVARNEDLTEFSVGLSRELRGGWELRGSYLWSDNDSSLERYSYSRNRTLVGISRAFGR